MMINEKRLRENFIKLASIDSPSFGERFMADEIIISLKNLGFQVSEDKGNETYGSQAGNVYGFLKGTLSGEPLLFSAHLDTVEPSGKKKVRFHEDGKLTSEGDTVLGADDISGIVEILEAVEAILEEEKEHRDIEVLFTFAEEAFLKGSAVADYTKIKSKEAYVLDLEGEIGTYAIKAPTVVAFTATITGKAAHAGFAPADGIHAIKAMSEVIAMTPLGILNDAGEDGTRMNIGTIHGGLGKNIVPAQCVIEGEIRSLVHEKAMRQLFVFEEGLKETCEKYGTEYSLKYEAPCIAYQVDEFSDTVVRFRKACEAAGIIPNPVITFGGSDQNNFALNGINGIVTACGMHQVHSTKEFTYIQEIVNTTKLVYQLMTGIEI